jgi:prepilin-type N-terminal cleavage/methylation domain-containing protein
MRLNSPISHPGIPDFSQVLSRRAFTLIEALLALSVSAIVLAAIGGVFFSAIRLRERTVALLDETGPVNQALADLRHDLKGALPPGGTLAGDFKCGLLSSGLVQGYGLQFCTTTGVINDEAPWGDIQEVIYQLRAPVGPSSGTGKELVRTVTRNLLATVVMNSDDRVVLGNVHNFEIACYDGTQWRDTWDTSLSDTNLPSALRIRLLLDQERTADVRNEEPMELIVPLLTQSRTNATASAGGVQ